MKIFRLVVFTLLLNTVAININSNEYLGSKRTVTLSKATLEKALQKIDQKIKDTTTQINQIQKSNQPKFVKNRLVKTLTKKRHKLQTEKNNIQSKLNK